MLFELVDFDGVMYEWFDGGVELLLGLYVLVIFGYMVGY